MAFRKNAFSSTYDIIILMKEGSTVPRRGQISKRDVLPDPLYNSKLVTKLVNNIMYDGKKGVANRKQSRSKYGAKRPKK